MSKISLHCPHNRQELNYLLELGKSAKSYLEIGARYGECLMQMGSGKERVVAVDLPGKAWGYPDSLPHLQRAAEKVGATLFIEDSTNPETVEKVRALGPYDLIFIDGDHKYEGVKKDWENYGPMGKVVVFHDIVKHNPKSKYGALEVWKLWQEIEGNKKEVIGEDSPMGIGIVWK